MTTTTASIRGAYVSRFADSIGDYQDYVRAMERAEDRFDAWLAEYRNGVIEDIADDIERHTVSSDEWWKNDFQNEYELAAHIREMKS